MRVQASRRERRRTPDLGGRYAYAIKSTSSSVETYKEMNDATMLITAICTKTGLRAWRCQTAGA